MQNVGLRDFWKRDPSNTNSPFFLERRYFCAACWQPKRAESEMIEAEYVAYHTPEAVNARKQQAKVANWESRTAILKRQSAQIARTAALPQEGDERVATMLRINGGVQSQNLDPKSVFGRYDSLTEFLAVLDQPVAMPPPENVALDNNDDYRSNEARRETLRAAPHWRLGAAWEGSPSPYTLDELKEFWFGGWTDGLARMREAMGRITVPETQDVRRRAVWAETGSEVSLERIYAGQYETAWRSTYRRRVTAPTKVRVVVDIGSACGACNQYAHDVEIVQASTLFWRGAAATALCETLDNAGFETEIVIAFAGNASTYVYENGVASYPTNVLACATTVKGFTDPAELAVITSATAAASVFRRAGLMWTLTVNPYKTPDAYHNLLRVQEEAVVRERLHLDEPDIATVYVPDWCLSASLANAWASATHIGIEAANDPDFEAFDFTEESK